MAIAAIMPPQILTTIQCLRDTAAMAVEFLTPRRRMDTLAGTVPEDRRATAAAGTAAVATVAAVTVVAHIPAVDIVAEAATAPARREVTAVVAAIAVVAALRQVPLPQDLPAAT